MELARLKQLPLYILMFGSFRALLYNQGFGKSLAP